MTSMEILKRPYKGIKGNFKGSIYFICLIDIRINQYQ